MPEQGLVIVASDPTAVLKSLSDMLSQLEDIPEEMAQEMTNWQTDDMHRQYPYTVLHSYKHTHTVSTAIWPRGQSESQREGEMQRKEERETRQFLASTSEHQSIRGFLKQAHWKRPKVRRSFRSRIHRISRQTYQRSSRRPVLREALFDMLVTRMTGLLESIKWL